MKILKIARIKKDLTQKELSKLLGLSPATISQLESGDKAIDDMRVRDLKKLCSVLDVSIYDILKL